ncbi:hypothetical protein AXK57_02220 [Tsukamurella pulmonis]|uniref:hypothetical protein n=1 Tax=Tsukamurella pulmonis TaxID=47312 RepID=UPI0007958516|nr:hypothetical protein [Tsukamurella pulmonis]KXP13070.1 hypothetical protein AXK57_02220 [Tsukamurella pulmonis]
MAEKTVDAMLDGGSACLQYFKDMLDIAKWVSFRTWPDWRDHVCRNYDNERGISLDSLRGDAVMLRQQATAAGQAVTDQATARTNVQTSWPDSAGRAAVTTLNTHQARSAGVAEVLDRTATAAESVPDAVVAAVAAKVAALSEFSTKEFNIGWGSGLKMTVLGALTNGVMTAIELNNLRIRFENQLGKDLVTFNKACATASSAIEAAYATVPAAAKGVDTSAFPAPSFQQITGTDGPTGGGGNGGGGNGGGGNGGGGTGGGGTGGGSPSTGSPSTATPTTTTPTTTSPTATSPTTSPTTTSPTTTPTSTSPAASTPSSATPSSGTGKDSSWLSQLLPKIAEQMGLGEKDKDGKDADKDAAGKDGEKDAKGEKVLGTDALGRTITATLSPDGKTVEVTAKKPDGTTEKVTLKVGEDGKLTPVDPKTGKPLEGTAEDGAAKNGETKDGAGKDGAAKDDPKTGGATPSAGGATPSAGGATPSAGGATPATTTANGTAPGAPSSSEATGSNTGGATPSTVVPPAPAGAPSKPPTGGQNGAPAEEPCPPEAPAAPGTGAEFAVSGT